MYDVHRSEKCPTGQHVVIDEATGAETTEGCDCPALVVRASGPPGPTEPHLMQWSRTELARLVGEFDRGYFDADGSPPRRLSMFVSAFQAELLDLMDRNPFAAVVRMLSRCVFHRVAFCFSTYQLSFELMPGQWAVIGLPEDEEGEVTYRLGTEAAGPVSQVLWERPLTADEQRATEADIRQQVRGLLTGDDGWEPVAAPSTRLHDHDEKLLEVTLGELAAAAEQLDLDDDPSAWRRGVVAEVPRPAAGPGVLPVEPAKGRARSHTPVKGKATPKQGGAKKRLPPRGQR